MLPDDDDSLENALYVTLHAAIMKVEDKLDKYDVTSNLIPLKDFIPFVLTPFVATLLIAEDKNLNLEDAVKELDASNEFGQVVHADDDLDEDIQILHQANIRAVMHRQHEVYSAPPFSQPPRHNRKKFDVCSQSFYPVSSA